VSIQVVQVYIKAVEVSKKSKAIERLKRKASDYKWKEAEALMSFLAIVS